MRSADEFNEVQRLIAAGMNDCAIARQTGVPRPTVRDWRCRPPTRLRQPEASSECGIDHDFDALPALPRSHRHLDARTTRVGRATTNCMRRCIAIQQTLAVSVSSAWSRAEARQTDPAGTLAGSSRQGSDRRLHTRSDSQRRLPSGRRRPRCEKHPVPLLEQI